MLAGKRIGAWTLIAWFAASPAWGAADYAREKKWADEILPGIVVGEPVTLTDAGGRRFLGLYTEVKSAKGAVVVVHGMGVHPDWGLVGVLRSQLADAGYTTLSVQMPVLAAEAKPEEYEKVFPEAAERLAAAVAYLKTKGYRKIALVSHSLGARMSGYYLANHADPPVAAWVAIGHSGRFKEPQNLKIPVLDLYGEADFPQVLEAASRRAAALKRLPGSAQVAVQGADHFFNGQEDALVAQVRAFLDRALAGPR
jgi:pimeloyl-ACP methyl ester carboxylesterase